MLSLVTTDIVYVVDDLVPQMVERMITESLNPHILVQIFFDQSSSGSMHSFDFGFGTAPHPFDLVGAYTSFWVYKILRVIDRAVIISQRIQAGVSQPLISVDC